MPIVVESLREQIRTVASRWAAQYKSSRYGQDKLEILKKLEALDVETATPKDVADIIGNTTWVGHPHCDNCGDYGVPTVQVGQEPDYESATAWLCLKCVKEAYTLLKNYKET